MSTTFARDRRAPNAKGPLRRQALAARPASPYAPRLSLFCSSSYGVRPRPIASRRSHRPGVRDSAPTLAPTPRKPRDAAADTPPRYCLIFTHVYDIDYLPLENPEQLLPALLPRVLARGEHGLSVAPAKRLRKRRPLGAAPHVRDNVRRIEPHRREK